jgi:hypothetical protein
MRDLSSGSPGWFRTGLVSTPTPDCPDLARASQVIVRPNLNDFNGLCLVRIQLLRPLKSIAQGFYIWQPVGLADFRLGGAPDQNRFAVVTGVYSVRVRRSEISLITFR